MLFMQNRTLLLLTLCFFLSGMVLAQKTPPPFKKFQHITNGDTLPYGVLSPNKVDAGKKYPLVIFLHGAGERGRDNHKHLKFIQILFTQNALNKYPCFVVAPQCPEGEVWSTLMLGKPFNPTPTRPMELFLQVYDQLLKEYPIDPSRIYVTGLSMGGFGTWDLIARYPNRFAAAVPICGGGDVKTVPLIKHIPIWAFHGALDPTVPPRLSRKMITALQEAGSSPGYTEYPGIKHSSWHQAYKEPRLMKWMFDQSLTNKK